MVGKAIDRDSQALSIFAVLLKRLLTEGVTGEMLCQCMTRVSPMALIKQEEYMSNLEFGSRCFN